MRSPVPRPAILVLAILLLELVPTSAVASMSDPVGPNVPPTGVPIVDNARQDIFEREQAVLDQVDAVLASQNLSSDSIVPPVPSRYFEDHFDNATRIGGLGNWTVMHNQTYGGNQTWRLGASTGANGTVGWTMSNASSGLYDTMDSWLISPAIDLSVYPVQTGILPYLSKVEANRPGPTADNTLQPALLTACPQAFRKSLPLAGPNPLAGLLQLCESPASTSFATLPFNDIIMLSIRHRYNLAYGADGGQVAVFDYDPTNPAWLDKLGIVLRPEGFGLNYTSVSTLDGEAFTGHQDWANETFDLTPWSGKKVWIGFHVATTPMASDDPSHDFTENFDHGAPYGWDVDDVKVVGPAYPYGVKVEAGQGPTTLLGSIPTFAPGDNATVGASILYAGSNPRMVRATVSVNGLKDVFPQQFFKVMQPGEVWQPTVQGIVDDVETVSINATAVVMAPDGHSTLPGFTNVVDGEQHEFDFPVRFVDDYSVSLSTDRSMVEEGASVVVTASLKNLGNVPLHVNLTAIEVGENLTSPPFANKSLFLAPGAAVQTSWTTSSSTPGAHPVLVNATGESGLFRQASISYYVHASPPPTFDVPAWPVTNWDDSLPIYPVPPHDNWMWVAVVDSSFPQPVLRALPTADATTHGGRFTDLVLKVRYMATANRGPATITLFDPNPVQPSGGGVGGASVGTTFTSFWNYSLPTHAPISSTNPWLLSSDSNMSWHEVEIPVDPQEVNGYPGVWSTNGPELELIPSIDASGRFFLDDLQLTGIPVGKGEADRVVLIQITGSEPSVASGALPSTKSPTGSSVAPAQPSVCPQQKKESFQPTQNCWYTMSASDAIANDTNPNTLHWSTATPSGKPYTLRDGTPALFSYHLNNGDPTPITERLVTPIIDLKQASDPILTFDHQYYFPSYPADTSSSVSKYSIQQVGYVELQYLQDDGEWSSFYRLIPDEGYHSPLETGYYGQDRTSLSTLTASDGFSWPGRCVDYCDQDGYLHNYDATGNAHWIQYDYPHMARSSFHLAQVSGVDLSNRQIRIGFRASTSTIIPTTTGAEWTIANVRVTPVSRFAIDGAADNLSLETPYDWRAIGVGPGTDVPLNLTVRNAGLFAEHFVARLNVSLLNGPDVTGPPDQDLGYLAPGEVRYVTIHWQVPLGENVSYQLAGRILPADPNTTDENAYNDAFAFGLDGSLVARTHADAALSTLVFPAKGDATLARYVPVVVQNPGNVPLTGLRVTRTIERVEASGHSILTQSTWTLGKTLPPDPAGVAIQSLDPSPPIQLQDLFVTPNETGEFAVTLQLDTGAAADSNLGDNIRLLTYSASEPLASDGFEGSELRWTASDPSLWSLGSGFRSPQGLEGTNRTDGAIPASTDSWIESPPIPLSHAKNAVVNLFAKYDLENGYDGVRLEVSNDGGKTWIPVDPMNPDGTQGAYPGNLTAANPLASGPEDQPPALTGDSHDAPVSLDGWVPLSFNLLHVPQLAQAVSFHDVTPPEPFAPAELLPVGESAYVAPSMISDAADATARWEIRNETEHVSARSGNMWWSNYTNGTGAVHLIRDFPPGTVPSGDTMTMQWWDWRAGSHGSSWQGVGAFYFVNFTQTSNDLPFSVRYPDITVLDKRGDWVLLQVQLDPSKYDPTLPLRVEFLLQPTHRGSDLGWAVEDVSINTGHVVNGKFTVDNTLTNADEEADLPNWTLNPLKDAWQRVPHLPQVQAPWRIDKAVGPDGEPENRWTIPVAKPGRLDTRLVTPSVDLTELVGARALLDVRHSYDLAFDEANNAYQGAAIEISVHNRTTGAWDDWKELFAEDGAPSPGLVPRPTADKIDGRPYAQTFAEVGDTFQRFPRSSDQLFYPGNNPFNHPYLHYLNVNTSYVFTGNSSGFREDTFDLAPYAGQEVRFAFHLWADSQDAAKNPPRFWTIAGAQVLGYVLSTPDAKVRIHMGTDESILPGSIQVDQFEVSGTPYAHSVGIQLDPIRPVASPLGVVNVTGRLVNYGPQERRLAGIILLNSTPTPFRAVRVLSPKPGTPPEDPIAGISGPFTLGRAGSETDSVPFSFQAYVGGEGTSYEVNLRVVDLTPTKTGFAPVLVQDDVPGRARVSQHVSVLFLNRTSLGVPTFSPPSAATPGPVVVSGMGWVNGSEDLDLAVHLDVRQDGGIVRSADANVGLVRAGSAFTYAFPPVSLPSEGNYTFVLTTADGAMRSDVYRVARNETMYQTSFEDGMEGWTAAKGSPPTAVVTDQARFGTHSLLVGYTDASGQWIGLDTPGGANGSLTSPRIDLRGAGPNPVLSFWIKPLFDRQGTVNLSLNVVTSGDVKVPNCPTIAFPSLLIHGRSSEWQHVQVPLQNTGTCAVLDNSIHVILSTSSAIGQGWRLDGVTVAAGLPVVTPPALQGSLVDSSSKTFRFDLANPGRSPRTVSLALDPNASKLSPVEASWLSVSPSTLTLAPGEVHEVDVHVDAPAARGAFPRDLQAVFDVRDALSPFNDVPLNLSLSFRPLPRQDLSAAVSIDGHAVGSSRFPVEEAVPHEIEVVVTNQGAIASKAAEVRIEVIDDATGLPVSTQTSSIEGLEPFSSVETTAIASASWKPAFEQRGNYTLRVVVDPDHRLVDYDRSNDDVRFPLEVVRLIRPDLAIERKDFTVGNSVGRAIHEATPGELLRISAVVENQGFADAHDVTVRLLADGALLKEETVPLLRAGDRYTMHANQFAPNSSATYSVLAFTSDLELRSDNNDQTLELAIFPAEILLGAEGATATLKPGNATTIPILVTDNGPYPVSLDLALPPGERLGQVEPSRVALAPGENATVNLTLQAGASEPAGPRAVVVKVRQGGEVVAQRSVDVDVAATPDALVIPDDAKGPPDALTAGIDIVNTGNVALSPTVRLVDDQGRILGERVLDTLPLGRSQFVNVTGVLPPTTPPGRIQGKLVVLQDGATVKSTPIDLRVLPWGTLNVSVGQPTSSGQGVAYDLRVSYLGNVPADRRPVLLGLPPGADARFNVSSLQLQPGQATELHVEIAASPRTPTGLYTLEAAFPGPDAADVSENLTPLSLDVRAAKLAFAGFQASTEDALAEGSLLTIDARVQDVGDAGLKQVPVQLFVDGVLVDATQVSLEPGTTAAAHLSWRGAPGVHGVVVAVDAYGPHAQDVPAWSRTIHVASSIIPGAGVAHRVGALDLGPALIAIALLALLVSREGRRRAR